MAGAGGQSSQIKTFLSFKKPDYAEDKFIESAGGGVHVDVILKLQAIIKKNYDQLALQAAIAGLE